MRPERGFQSVCGKLTAIKARQDKMKWNNIFRESLTGIRGEIHEGPVSFAAVAAADDDEERLGYVIFTPQ